MNNAVNFLLFCFLLSTHIISANPVWNKFAEKVVGIMTCSEGTLSTKSRGQRRGSRFLCERDVDSKNAKEVGTSKGQGRQKNTSPISKLLLRLILLS